MLKEGRHQCKGTAPTNGWFGTAGQNNSPFIRIPFVITEGDCEGHHDVYQAWITDSALARTVKNLADVFGWDGDLERLSRAMTNGPFVDKPFSIVVEPEDYQGKTTLKIKWLNKAGDGAKVLSQDAALALAARLNAAAKAAATGKPAATSTAEGPW